MADLGEGGCIVWTGFVNREGYGHTRDHKQAHRVAYEKARGPIPEGLEIDHLCRNRSCVNPNHLEAVTHAENMRRRSAFQTHCKHGHEFTPENTRIRRSRNGLRRECRACNRAAVAAYALRRKAAKKS